VQISRAILEARRYQDLRADDVRAEEWHDVRDAVVDERLRRTADDDVRALELEDAVNRVRVGDIG
jgi:hypothetical protein